MTLTSGTHLASLTNLFEYLKKFETYGCNGFQIIYNFHFSYSAVQRYDNFILS